MLFLPSIFIPRFDIPVYDIFIGLTLLCLFICTNSIKRLFNFIKYRFFRILIYYILWIIFTGFILIIIGKFTFINYLYGVFLVLLYNNFSWYIYSALVFPKFFSVKFLIRALMIGVYFICLYGLIEYIFHNIFHSNILEPILKILNNRRYFIIDNFEPITTRIYSVFEEPGYLGCFICINLPIIYKLICSRYKILRNKISNFLLKKTYIPILILTIFAVQSPIWFLCFIIITVLCFYKNIIKSRFRIGLTFLSIVITGFLSILYFHNNNISEIFLNRIIETTRCLNNYTALTKLEPSLASRIFGYNARIQLFLKYPIAGVGYKNTENNILEYVLTSKLPHTEEIDRGIQKVVLRKGNFIKVSGAIFWNSLSDTGLIGTLLLYLFMILSVKKLSFIIKKINKGLTRNFIEGVRYSYIIIIVISIYDIRLNFIYIWFLFGLTLSFIQYYNLYYKKLSNKL